MTTETVLSITTIGVDGIAHGAQLGARFGRCEGTTHFGNVTLTASRGNGQTKVRYFDLPRDLAAAFTSGPPCYLAPGVLVGTAKVDRADYQVEGPGATMFQAIRQTSGVSNRLPALPAAWLAAIHAAV